MSTPVLRLMYDERRIQARIIEMAAHIQSIYGDVPLTLAIILDGGMMFGTELLKRLHPRTRLITIKASSYGDGQVSSGTVKFDPATIPDVRGQHIILVDDIYDTGLTINTLRQTLLDMGAQTVRECVLLSRLPSYNVPDPCVGFHIDKQFAVGFGMDHQGQYRGLPYISEVPA